MIWDYQDPEKWPRALGKALHLEMQTWKILSLIKIYEPSKASIQKFDIVQGCLEEYILSSGKITLQHIPADSVAEEFITFRHDEMGYSMNTFVHLCG